MNRLPLVALGAAIVAGVVIVARTSADLPALVASHYGLTGQADGFFPRTAYVAVTLGLLVAVPILTVLKVVFLPQQGRARGRRGLPNLDYWLAPERRTATRWRLANYAAVLGCLLVAFLTAMHLVILDANAHAPPRLPPFPFAVALITFIAAVAVWTVLLRRAFRRSAH